MLFIVWRVVVHHVLGAINLGDLRELGAGDHVAYPQRVVCIANSQILALGDYSPAISRAAWVAVSANERPWLDTTRARSSSARAEPWLSTRSCAALLAIRYETGNTCVASTRLRFEPRQLPPPAATTSAAPRRRRGRLCSESRWYRRLLLESTWCHPQRKRHRCTADRRHSI